MRVLNDPIPKNGGSSTLLVILVIVSFIVVMLLMIRSSSNYSELAEGERGAGEQEGAVDSSFEVFESYDSLMDGGSGAGADKDVPRQHAPQPAAPPPLRPTEQPGKNEAVPGPSPTVIPIKSKEVAIPPAGNTGALNAPHDGIEALAPDGNIWPADSGEGRVESRTGNKLYLSGRGDERPGEAVVEHILPDSGISPDANAPVFIRENRGTGTSVRLAAGHDAPGRPPAPADAERELVARALEADPVNRLSPPLFSLGSGEFPVGRFNLKLKFANPNPKNVSRLLYSLDSTRWKLYEGSEITVPPNSTVSAYCESLDPDWRDSLEESRDYVVDVTKLEVPRISASAPAFDKQANRRILVSLLNPNSLVDSRVEYRIDGGLWHPYTLPFNLEASRYEVTGVTVEARAVAVRGTSRPQDSDAIALEFNRPKKRSLAASRDGVTFGEPRAVDLGMPAISHGYSERGPVVAGGGIESRHPSADERLVMANHASYRKSTADAAWPGTVADPGLRALPVSGLSGIGSNFPSASVATGGIVAENLSREATSDFDLFESTIAAENLPPGLAWELGGD